MAFSFTSLLISSLACLTPLLSSSMILSVLLVNLEFCALNSLTRFLASGY
ncbi:hypothetical protein JT112_03925 [Helicobacter pylori]|nr:hypothetical protein [Helicobacter pylori]MCQ2885340.1 hypothetical protein [Helicobacter pylori]